MLERYARPALKALWSLEEKYQTWLEVELHATEAMAKYGMIPQAAAITIRQKARFDTKRIEEIERETRHDFIAFLTSVSESVGADARFLHQGLTSSDVIDTAFSLLLRRSALEIEKSLDRLLGALKDKMITHRHTLCMGRSHGMHAEPTSFGLKMASHFAAFTRAKARLKCAVDEISVCALSGAVGSFATVDMRVEQYVAEKLGLRIEPVSTQVIPRDRHAVFFAVLGVIASSLENLAIELRHLQRTEVREVEEGFGKGQKGSSAMPHKKNPISSENITGLARHIRAMILPAFENIALWHERDMSHSSVERFIAPDATVTLDYMLDRMANVVEHLVVDVDQMQRNLGLTKGLIYSQKILLLLTQKGLTREEAYQHVQAAALQTWSDHGAKTFIDYLFENPKIADIVKLEECREVMNPKDYIKNADFIIERVLSNNA